MMNDMKKSDEPVRAMRPANNGGRPPAESAEQRGSTEENSGSQTTRRTQSRVSVSLAAARIRQATAVCRQLSEVGAGWTNVHVRICAGGAGKPAFLPRRMPGELAEGRG